MVNNEHSVDSNQPAVLMLGKLTIKANSVIGPYASLGPHTSGYVLPKGKDGMVWEGIMPALRAHTTYRTATNPKGKLPVPDRDEALLETVWTPAVSVATQILGGLLVLVLHALAIAPGMALLYAMTYEWIPFDGEFCTGVLGRCYLFYALYQFFWVWLFGTVYALLVVLYKWLAIGKFEAGQRSTPSLDARRWVLQSLLQSRLLVSFVFAGASSPIISTFYRLMGAKIGWNAQVMPINVLEFDLLTVGKNVSFGGQVTIFGRDHAGDHATVVIGDDCAVTNSAIMLAGSSCGAGSLVGDLTLVARGEAVPPATKCVGAPNLQFPALAAGTDESSSRAWSDWIMFLHTLASLWLESVSMLSWVVITFTYSPATFNWIGHFDSGPAGAYGYWGFAVAMLIMMPIMAVCNLLMLIAYKRVCVRFHGGHERDSWAFVQFIFMTKAVVAADSTLLRMLSGTPFMPLMYRLMGNSNVALDAVLLNRHTADFDMLTVGPGAVVDFDAYVELHYKTSRVLQFDPVVIGDGAVVGARSILLRGAEAEPEARVLPLSMVLPGEPVAAGAIWGGLPCAPVYTPPATDQLRRSVAAAGIATTTGRDRDQRLSFHRRSSLATGGASRVSMRVSAAQAHLDARMSQRLDALRQSVATMHPCPTRASAAAFASDRASTSTSASTAVASPPAVQIVDPEVEGVDVDMVVVGAGNMGLMAAFEFSQAGASVRLLEKTGSAFGCWRTQHGANPTSHVAVTEPSYRFPTRATAQQQQQQQSGGSTTGATAPSDYTSQPELLESGGRFLLEHPELEEAIAYHCEVVDVQWRSESPPRVDVTYRDLKTRAEVTVRARGVYMALGAQQQARELEWEGEAAFREVEGTVVGYGVRGDVDAAGGAFRGKRVVIIGNGAFAVENARTALMHGAAHVTLVFRRAFQCWPRAVHYLASKGGMRWGEIGAPYEAWREWAGMGSDALGESGMDDFMSLNTFSQPSASDFVFGAHKAGLLAIVKGEVERCVAASPGGGPGVALKGSGEFVPCEVFLKCIGWHMPDLKAVMPAFESRNFCFLNGKANVVFCCDPHYQVDALNGGHAASSAPGGAKRRLAAGKGLKRARRELMMKEHAAGGTFSNIVLARATAQMQLYMMSKPLAFGEALRQMPSSPSAMCSWFEQRFQFDGMAELNTLLDGVIAEGKDALETKFPQLGPDDHTAFVQMAAERYRHDMAQTVLGSSGVHLEYPMDGLLRMTPEQAQVRG